MADTKHDDLFDVIKKSGAFEDKTFLVFFGAWKHKKTGESQEFFSKYLGCSVEEAVALLTAKDWRGLQDVASGQTHVHLDARYVKSGAWVALQITYSGPPEFGMAAMPALILEGEAAKRALAMITSWQDGKDEA